MSAIFCLGDIDQNKLELACPDKHDTPLSLLFSRVFLSTWLQLQLHRAIGRLATTMTKRKTEAEKAASKAA